MNEQPLPGSSYSPSPPPSQNPTPAPNPNIYPQQPPPDPKKKRLKIILIVAGSFVAIMLILSVAVVVGRNSKKAPTPTPTPEVAKAKFEDIATTNTFIGTAPDTKKFVLSLTVPTDWRATQSSSAVSGWPYNVAQFKFLVSSIASTSAVDGRKKERLQNDITTQNAVTVSDLTKWLKVDETANCPYDINCGPFGNIKSIADKTKFYNYLLGLTTESKVTAADLAFFKPAVAAETGGKQAVSVITADNGNLKGVAYIVNYGVPEAYSPSLVVLMAGTLNKKPVLYDGRFLLQDKLYQDIATEKASADENYKKDLTKALSDFAAGSFSAQMLQIRDEALAAVKTTKLELVN